MRHASVAGYVWAFFGVFLATAFLSVLKRYLDAGDESLLYLPVVIGLAFSYGFGPAVLGALISFCCWDYFFDVPYYAFTISNAHDLISLVMYLVVAVTIARLTSRAKDRTREAEARELETATLYQASSALSREIDTHSLLMTLVQQIVSLSRASKCIVYLHNMRTGELLVSARSSDEVEFKRAEETILQTAQSVMRDGKIVRVIVEQNSTDLYVPLEIHGETVGVLFVGATSDGIARTLQEDRLIMTLANHASVVIERQSMAEDAQEQARHTAVLDERNRLARDVHDTLSHAFTGIKFLLEAASRIDSRDQSQNCIDQARSLAVEGAQEARRSVLALRPAALEESGTLVEALRKLASQKSAGGTVSIESRTVGEEQDIEPSVEENLLRIAQEAMTNALKHSHATKIIITLTFTQSHIQLTIADNGTGFDPTGIQAGFGLTSMRERTSLIDGTILIGPGRHGGTEINVRALHQDRERRK